MPRATHIERHFTASEVIRDLVIGMSDGLTVPFALAAGLSGAVQSNPLIVTAGLAEIAAGGIAMGLGGYLAAKGDAEHYYREHQREVQEVREKPEEEKHEVKEVFRRYGLTDAEIEPILRALQSRPKDWVNFMMHFELGIEEPHPARAVGSAATISGAYIAAGLIPLAPYMLLRNTQAAFVASAAITMIALFVFGYVKGRLTSTAPLKGAVQMLVVGGLAAAAAFLIARLVSS